MEKKEAAEYLGVSTRTLERFATAGKLTKGRARKKTRPVVVYDKKELAALKKELESSRPSEVFGRPNTPKPQDAIGFRLDPFYVKKLTEIGKQSGMSPSEYARRLVIRSLEGQTQSGTADELTALRKSLADMFFLVLVSKLDATEAEATEIVKKITGGV